MSTQWTLEEILKFEGEQQAIKLKRNLVDMKRKRQEKLLILGSEIIFSQIKNHTMVLFSRILSQPKGN